MLFNLAHFAKLGKFGSAFAKFQDIRTPTELAPPTLAQDSRSLPKRQDLDPNGATRIHHLQGPDLEGRNLELGRGLDRGILRFDRGRASPAGDQCEGSEPEGETHES